jgi:HEAT repeat protein
MKLIRTTMLALLMATATIAQAKNAGRDEPAPTEQEELAIAALEGLMAQPAERSMPILKKVMAGPQSPIVKRRALFVLSQVGSAEAREIVMQTARSGNPELRGEAIRSIGISGDPKSLDALQEVYKAGTPELKEDVLQAWMIAGRKDSVYQAALAARTEDEASAAIRTLGVMGAKEELRKLAERPDTPDGLVDALAISGDLAGLRKIADGNGPIQLREDAVQNIGIISSDAARAALREIYASSANSEIKEAALHGMLIAQDEKGVLALYRAAKSTDEKRSLLRILSMMNGDAALEAIDAALEKK